MLTKNLPRWISTISLVIGIFTLFTGLNVQLVALFWGKTSLDHATNAYLFGALVLTIAPTIDYFKAVNKSDKDFPLLLIMLEVYLALSSLLFYWNPTGGVKVFTRIVMSLVVTLVMKIFTGQLSKLRWEFFYNPWYVMKYHWFCFKNKFKTPAYPMVLRIDWLGLGYAFLSLWFGKVAFLFGAAFLFLSSKRALSSAEAGHRRLPTAWCWINAFYFLYGFVFLGHALFQ